MVDKTNITIFKCHQNWGGEPCFISPLTSLSASVPFPADNTKIPLGKVNDSLTRAGHTCQDWSSMTPRTLFLSIDSSQLQALNYLLVYLGEGATEGLTMQTKLGLTLVDLIFSSPFNVWRVFFLFFSLFVCFAFFPGIGG